MSYLVYKLIHLSGIFMILMSLAGMTMHVATGGKKKTSLYKRAAIAHGIGMFVALLGGFGMLARLGIHWPWPGYIFVKVGIWVVMGGLITFIYKKPSKSTLFWNLTLVLAIAAGYLALMKPF